MAEIQSPSEPFAGLPNEIFYHILSFVSLHESSLTAGVFADFFARSSDAKAREEHWFQLRKLANDYMESLFHCYIKSSYSTEQVDNSPNISLLL